jgi:hypothetical protein
MRASGRASITYSQPSSKSTLLRSASTNRRDSAPNMMLPSLWSQFAETPNDSSLAVFAFRSPPKLVGGASSSKAARPRA